jgi:hypothetical protein
MKNKIIHLFPIVIVAIAGFFLLFANSASADTILEFDYQRNGTVPPAQNVNIYNQTAGGGGAIVQWRAEGYDDWLTVEPTQSSASINPGGNISISIRPNRSDLGEIGSSTTVTFLGYDSKGNVAPGSGQTVVVNYGLAFIATKNGPLPDARPITITNTTYSGGETIDRWEAKNYASWLTVTPGSSDTDIPAGGKVQLSMRPNVSSMNAGSYTTVIDFIGYDSENQTVIGSVQKVYVKYVIKNPQLIFSAVKNSSTLPAGQTVQMFSTSTQGAANISSWETTGNASWLAAAPASGGISSGSTGSVVIRPNTTSLNATTYNSSVKFNGKDGGGNVVDSTMVDVKYVVTDTCAITDFKATPGQVNYGGSSKLEWTLSGECVGWILDGGKFDDVPGLTSPQDTGPLHIETPYTLRATGSDGVTTEKTVRVLVTGGSNCTIHVNAEYNGTIQNPPGSPYVFTISGPETITGSGPNSYVKEVNSSAWTIMYNGGTSVVFKGYNQQTQSCSSPGGEITFTLKFSSEIGNPPPGTSSNAVCSQINLSWSSVTGAASYNIYRSTNSNDPGSTPLATGITANQYSDTTAAPATTYYYFLEAVHPSGNSEKIRFNPQSGITVRPCGADFGTSNKVITQVNGKAYKVTSACRIPNQAGVVTSIKKGDRLTMAINVCNTGSVDAQNVIIKDSFNGNNISLVDRSSIKFLGTSGTYTEAGNIFTFNVGEVKAGKNIGIVFDVLVTPPSDSTQKLMRLRNLGELTFTTNQPVDNGGCTGKGTTSTNPCRLDTGYIVFSNGLKAPDQTEVNP